MSKDKDLRRSDRQELENALSRAGARIRGRNVNCPFHEDKSASMSIRKDRVDGFWRAKCHGCGWRGDVYDVEAATTGKSVAEVLKAQTPTDRLVRKAVQTPAPVEPNVPVFTTIDDLVRSIQGWKNPKTATEAVDDVYRYQNADTGDIEMVVVRYRVRNEDGSVKKRFCQCRPCCDGWVWLAPPHPWPLFNRTRLKQANTAIVVEGEKACKALHAIGFISDIVPTTSPGGAGKAGYANWQPLAGKTVYLWPDNDQADPKTGLRNGIKHMQEVAAELDKLEPRPKVYWIDPDIFDLPDKSDVVEFVEAFGGDTDESKHNNILSVLKIAKPIGPARELWDRLDDIKAGRIKDIAWPWPILTEIGQMLVTGTVTMVCGDPGARKSYAMLQAIEHWHRQGIKWALYALEEDRGYHLQRVLAHLEQDRRFQNLAWMHNPANHALLDVARERHQDTIDGMAPNIYAAPKAQVTYAELEAWAEERAKAGAEIIIIDPITYTKKSPQPWIDDDAFLFKMKLIALNYGCRIVLVTHPRTAAVGKNVGGSGMAGGAAFHRFAQSAFWIRKHDQPENVAIFTHDRRQDSVEVDSIWQLHKTRNGTGQGLDIAMRFHRRSLLFEEMGLVCGESSKHAESVLKGDETDPFDGEDPFAIRAVATASVSGDLYGAEGESDAI